jgi:hypothetical protein
MLKEQKTDGHVKKPIQSEQKAEQVSIVFAFVCSYES